MFDALIVRNRKEIDKQLQCAESERVDGFYSGDIHGCSEQEYFARGIMEFWGWLIDEDNQPPYDDESETRNG